MSRLERILFFIWTTLAAVVTAACIGLLISMLTACAARPRMAPIAPVDVPWCAWSTVRIGDRVVHVLACTEDEDACNDGRKAAESPLGRMAGVRAVDECEEMP